jgi:hypothetical protein
MKLAILCLQWVLGVVVLLQSIHFALSSGAIHDLAKAGLPQWAGPALGGSEAIAALLFLVPAASVVAGWLLLAIFAIAAMIHFLLGEFNVGGLVIYSMAVIVCITYRRKGIA